MNYLQILRRARLDTVSKRFKQAASQEMVGYSLEASSFKL